MDPIAAPGPDALLACCLDPGKVRCPMALVVWAALAGALRRRRGSAAARFEGHSPASWLMVAFGCFAGVTGWLFHQIGVVSKPLSTVERNALASAPRD
jgi:hypothetical protein